MSTPLPFQMPLKCVASAGTSWGQLVDEFRIGVGRTGLVGQAEAGRIAVRRPDRLFEGGSEPGTRTLDADRHGALCEGQIIDAFSRFLCL